MTRICQITGKGPRSGNKVSHSNRKTRRRFLPNLQSCRVWVESEKRFVKLRLSTQAIRLIDKLGVAKVLSRLAERSR